MSLAAVLGVVALIGLLGVVGRGWRFRRLRAHNTAMRDLGTGRALSQQEIQTLQNSAGDLNRAAAEGVAVATVGTAAHALLQVYLLDSGTGGVLSASAGAEAALDQAAASMGAFEPSVVQAVSAMSARLADSVDPSVAPDADSFMVWFSENVNAPADLGAFLRLKGYVGEQQLADALEAQGHTVVLASTANNPGWDMLVDGEMLVNAKTHMTVYAAAAEARNNPDLFYAVPTDAAGSTDLPNLFTVEGFSNASVHDAMNATFAQAESAQAALDSAGSFAASADVLQAQADAAVESLVSGDFLADALGAGIPITLVAFTAYRQVKAVRDGKPWADAVKDGSLDVVVKGTGILVGAAAGGKAGLILDATGITFGLPIGAVVGSIAGAAAGSAAGAVGIAWWKDRHVRAATGQLKSALAQYGSQFTGQESLDRLTEILAAPAERSQRALMTLAEEHDADRRTLRWWLWPSDEQVRREQALLLATEEVSKALNLCNTHIDHWNEILSGPDGEVYLGLAMVNSPVLAAELGADVSGLDAIEEWKDRLTEAKAARRV
jgi:hypothetical protein